MNDQGCVDSISVIESGIDEPNPNFTLIPLEKS